MEKRLRTNLALLGAIALLALVAWFAPDRDLADPALQVFPEQIRTVHVLHAGRPQLALEKTGTGWQLLMPEALPANDFQVESLLATFRQPAARRYAARDADLGQLGLDNPEWRLQVNDVSAMLGARSAIGDRAYLMRGDTVFLVDSALAFRLQRSPWDYASRKPVPDFAQIIGLDLPDGHHVTRDGSGWKVLPEQPDISSDELQDLVDAWRQAEALAVGPVTSVPRSGEVRVRLQDGSSLVFGIERRDGKVLLARDAPAVMYTLDAAQAAKLLELAQGAGGN